MKGRQNNVMEYCACQCLVQLLYSLVIPLYSMCVDWNSAAPK